MSQTTATPRFSVGALASLLLALPVVTAPAGLLVGFYSLRAINRSDGQIRGRRLALAGLVAGALGTLLLLIGVGAMILVEVNAKSQREVCRNNLRQIGLAVNGYHDFHNNQFPPALVGNPSLHPWERPSWLVGILPYLNLGTPANQRWAKLYGDIDLQDMWDAPANQKLVQPTVPMYLCPAHPTYDRRGLARTSYPGLAGIDPDAVLLPRTSARAGFFGYDRVITPADVTAGISNTMMAVETAEDNGPWAAGGPPTVRGLNPDEAVYCGFRRPFGGLHRGITNALWVDGHALPVLDNIRPEVFRAYAVLRRAEGDEAGK